MPDEQAEKGQCESSIRPTTNFVGGKITQMCQIVGMNDPEISSSNRKYESLAIV